MNSIVTTVTPSTVKRLLGFFNPLCPRNDDIDAKMFDDETVPIHLRLGTKAQISQAKASKINLHYYKMDGDYFLYGLFGSIGSLVSSISIAADVFSSHGEDLAWDILWIPVLLASLWSLIHSISWSTARDQALGLNAKAEFYSWKNLLGSVIEKAHENGLGLPDDLKTLSLLLKRTDAAEKAALVSLDDTAALANVSALLHRRNAELVYVGDCIVVSGETSELLSRVIDTMSGDGKHHEKQSNMPAVERVSEYTI